MPHARRRFLRQLAFAGAALVALRPGASRAAAGATHDANTGSSFASLLGTEFTAVTEAGERHPLRLAEVSRPKSLEGYADPARARERCFTLVLHGDANRPLAEGIHRIAGPGVAPFDAFVSPILGDGRTYQIVFGAV